MSGSTDLQQRIDSIQAKYQPRIDALEADGRKLADGFEEPSTGEVIVDAEIEVTWANRTIAFDVPQFTMKREHLILDIPEVTMQRQRIVFDTPSIRLENRVVGKYPVFRGPKVTMKDIVTKVPVTFMERQEIIYDIPGVTMRPREIVLDLPEIRMGRVEWVLKLPEFKVLRVSAEIDRIKDEGEALKARGAELAAAMKAEIEAVVMGAESLADLEIGEARALVDTSFGTAIESVDKAITDLKARGCDPVKVPTDAGEVNLRKVIATLIEQRDAAQGQVAAIAGA